MEDTIKLRIGEAPTTGGSIWYAQFCGSDAERIRRLFGRDELPTPFGASVPAVAVIEKVRAKNPGYNVVVVA